MKAAILFLMPLPPPVHGSSVVSKQILSSKKIQSSFYVDWINIATSRKMEEIGASGILLNLKKIFRFTFTVIRLITKLIFNHYDLCYLAITCHGKGFLKDVPFVLICKAFKKKVIIHQHNKGMKEDIDNPLYSFLLRKAYNNSKVILLSWLLFDDISAIVKKENVYICPNGIPDLKPSFNKEIINSDHPRILFISNLLKSKGVLLLLDALKLLDEEGVSYNCALIGAETNEISKQDIQNEISIRELKSCFYHGPKYGTDKIEFLEKADIFAFPSYNESFSLVILEAMEYSLPVITTNVGGLADIVKDSVNGFVLHEHNAKQLAKKLKLLITNPELRQAMSTTSRQMFKNYFTEEIFEERLCSILFSVTNNECQRNY